MPEPVILLAFANTQDSYLPMIKRERKNIYRSLRRHHDNDLIQVEKSEHTSLEDLFETIQNYKDRLSVFHFGGHAGQHFLQLESPTGHAADARATGIAQLLGQLPHLRLVFLNGCATSGQVNYLLNQGVPAVIATRVAVDDQMATEFAEQFYLSLGSHATIEKAFYFAKAFLTAKYDGFDNMGIRRGVAAEEVETDIFNWNLFLNKDKQEALQWAFPKSKSRPVIRNRTDYDARIAVNDILIDTICEDLAKYSKDLDYELSKDQLDIPAIKREIIDCFPTPIGEQLRKLFTRSSDPANPDTLERFTRQRLQQLARTYRHTVQFISFIMLSQLWDEKFENPALQIQEDYIVEFNSFFALSHDSFQSFDYVKLIKTITDLFDHQGIAYFIEELNKVKIDVDTNPDLYEAYIFFNSIYQELDAESIGSDRLEALCIEAERHLGIILKEFAFLVKYKLMTIKNIEIIKMRHESARFRHSQVLLNRAMTVAGTGNVEVGVEFSNYADNQSVLFLKTEENKIIDYLSLTPFLIDENALTRNYSSKLFMYSYSQKETYYYQFVNSSRDEKLGVNEDKYPVVKSLFERFKMDLFGVMQTETPPAGPIGTSRFGKKKFTGS